MKQTALHELSVDQLVLEYIKLSAVQGETLYLCGSSAKINRVGKGIFAIQDELARRSGSDLLILTTLFSHPNPWVRYNAADALLDTVPQMARPVIQAIADSKEQPIAFHAGMTLNLFDGELSDLRHPARD